MLSHFGHVRLFATLWTVAHQLLGPRDYPGKNIEWVPFPSPRVLPSSGIEPISLKSPALANEFFTISATWEAWAPQTIETKRKEVRKKLERGQSFPALNPEAWGCLEV